MGSRDHLVRRAYRLVAAGALCACVLGAGAYVADAASPPLIERFTITRVTETAATLKAVVDPEGASTKYAFWVEYRPCQHGAGECALGPQTEQVGHGEVAAGSAGVAVHRVVGKLRHGCEYTFWISAVNTFGESESARRAVTTAGTEGLGCLR